MGSHFLSFRNFAVIPPLATSVCLGREELDELVTEASGVSGHGLVWGTAVRFIPCLPIRTVRLRAVAGFSQVGPLLGASTLHPTGPQKRSPQPKCPGALVNTGLWAPPESFPFEGLGCAQVPRDADSAGDLLVLGTTGPGYVVTCLMSMGLSVPIWDTRGPILNSWGRKQREREEIQDVEIKNRKNDGRENGTPREWD